MFALLPLNKTVVAIPFKYSQQNRSMTSCFNRGVKFLFKKYLLLTNSVTSGFFMVIGDLVQQEFEYSAKLIPKRYDWGRAGRMFLIGTAMGPFHHYYYLQLDKVLPKSDIKTVIKKVLCDQLMASPATILCFYYGMGYLENKTITESTDEIKKKFLYVYGGDCLFWPPVQIVNFCYLPPMYRVFYINFATMIFNVYMSFMKHYDQH